MTRVDEADVGPSGACEGSGGCASSLVGRVGVPAGAGRGSTARRAARGGPAGMGDPSGEVWKASGQAQARSLGPRRFGEPSVGSVRTGAGREGHRGPGYWGPATEPPRSTAPCERTGTASNLPCAWGVAHTPWLYHAEPRRPGPRCGRRSDERSRLAPATACTWVGVPRGSPGERDCIWGPTRGRSTGRPGTVRSIGLAASVRAAHPPQDVRRAGSPVHRGRSRSRCVPEGTP
jgi:hypothetical protein